MVIWIRSLGHGVAGNPMAVNAEFDIVAPFRSVLKPDKVSVTAYNFAELEFEIAFFELAEVEYFVEDGKPFLNQLEEFDLGFRICGVPVIVS